MKWISREEKGGNHGIVDFSSPGRLRKKRRKGRVRKKHKKRRKKGLDPPFFY